jgi:hypothetical protein
MALTDAGLDDLRASLYQGLCDAKVKADKLHEAMKTLQYGTMEYDRLNTEYYIHHGEVEAYSRALLLIDRARRSARSVGRVADSRSDGLLRADLEERTRDYEDANYPDWRSR